MESAIYIYIYSFFYGTFMRASTNPRTVVLHTHSGRKGNKLKRRLERERKARQNKLEIQNKQGWM